MELQGWTKRWNITHNPLLNCWRDYQYEQVIQVLPMKKKTLSKFCLFKQKIYSSFDGIS